MSVLFKLIRIMSEGAVARLKNVEKSYKSGDSKVLALKNTSIDIYKNELTLIMGPSGSGKTTLLSLLGCVIYPSEGQIFIENEEISIYTEKKLALIRLKKIGFVFQHFNLIQPLSALDNVMQPLLLQGVGHKQAKIRAKKMLETVSLLDKRNSLPKHLSGGQKQRVAIARALVTGASLLLCDEPTASLDARSAERIMIQLKALAGEGKAVVVVSHDNRLKHYADRVIYVEEGRIIKDPTDE